MKRLSQNSPPLAGLIFLPLLLGLASEAEPAGSELVARAEAAVVAEVVDAVSYWRGELIWTDAALRVVQCHKGGLSVGQTLVVSEMGGEVGGIGQRVSHAPRYKRGSYALALLERRPDGSFRTVGGAQGMELLVRKPDGSFAALSAPASESSRSSERAGSSPTPETSESGSTESGGFRYSLGDPWPADKIPVRVFVYKKLFPGVSKPDLKAAAQQVADEWNAVEETSFQFATPKLGNKKLRAEGKSRIVSVKNLLGPDEVTAPVITTVDGALADVDVLINADLDYMMDVRNRRPGDTVYDITSVLRQAFGLIAGLDYSANQQAVMYSPLASNAQTALSSDDERGLQELYPEAVNRFTFLFSEPAPNPNSEDPLLPRAATIAVWLRLETTFTSGQVRLKPMADLNCTEEVHSSQGPGPVFSAPGIYEPVYTVTTVDRTVREVKALWVRYANPEDFSTLFETYIKKTYRFR